MDSIPRRAVVHVTTLGVCNLLSGLCGLETKQVRTLEKAQTKPFAQSFRSPIPRESWSGSRSYLEGDNRGVFQGPRAQGHRIEESLGLNHDELSEVLGL